MAPYRRAWQAFSNRFFFVANGVSLWDSLVGRDKRSQADLPGFQLNRVHQLLWCARVCTPPPRTSRMDLGLRSQLAC